MNIRSRFNRQYLFLAFAVFVILVTNRWMGLEEGARYTLAWDSFQYIKIANHAPKFPELVNGPDESKKMYTHIIQRFPIHFLVGLSSRATGLSLGIIYRLTVVVLFGLIFWVFHLLLCSILGLRPQVSLRPSINSPVYSLAMVLLVSNPYFLRYYLLAPAMLADLLFILGIGLSLFGLLKGSVPYICIGVLLGALGKQNVVTVALVMSAWMWFGWPRKSRIMAFLPMAIAGSTLWVTSHIVRPYSVSGIAPFNELTILQLFQPPWWPNLKILFDHFARSIVVFLIPGLLCLAWGRRPLFKSSRQMLWLILFSLAALSHALVIHPNVLRQCETRFATLAIIPVLFTMVMFLESQSLRPQSSVRPWLLVYCIILISSLHHMFSWIGPSSKLGFASLQVLCALACTKGNRLLFCKQRTKL